MIDGSSLQFLLLILTSWLDRREREVLGYLVEEESPAFAASSVADVCG